MIFNFICCLWQILLPPSFKSGQFVSQLCCIIFTSPTFSFSPSHHPCNFSNLRLVTYLIPASAEIFIVCIWPEYLVGLLLVFCHRNFCLYLLGNLGDHSTTHPSMHSYMAVLVIYSPLSSIFPVLLILAKRHLIHLPCQIIYQVLSMHAAIINNQDLVQAFLFLVYTPYKLTGVFLEA